MCLIDPDYMEKYERGVAVLAKESLCTSCGKENWADVHKGDVLTCAGCGGTEAKLIGNHYPDAKH